MILATGKKNIYFSTYPPSTLIHLSHCFPSASKPAAQKSFDCCLSHFRTSVSNSSSSVKCLPPSCEPVYATNTSNRKQETFLWVSFALSPFAHKKRIHNRTLLFGSSGLKLGRHFDYWNQPLNMCMRVCYLSWSWTVLLPSDTHIENLLRPLQLFYFHLCPVDWLSLIFSKHGTMTRCENWIQWYSQTIKSEAIFWRYRRK
jgi:hypothetical protein